MRPLRGPLAAAICGLLLTSGHAVAARAPDVLKRSITYRDQAAQALAQLLRLPPKEKATIHLELSQDAEHRALPERDEALRTPDGFLSSQLAWNTSDQIRLSISWQPHPPLLRIDGYLLDASTGIPAAAGPVCVAFSPMVSQSEIDRLPGWRTLYRALLAAPATPGRELLIEERRLETALPDHESAVLRLQRIKDWDNDSRPVEKSLLSFAFGPAVGEQACRDRK